MTYDQFLAKLESSVRIAFLAAIQDIVDSVILADLIAAIEADDPTKAFQIVGMSNIAFAPLQDALQSVFVQGGQSAASAYPKHMTTPQGVRTLFRFDHRDTVAEEFVRNQSSENVTRITAETRDNLQIVMQDGLIAGRNPRSVALDIVGRVDPVTKERVGGIVGLSGPQARAVLKARSELKNLDMNYFTRERRDKRMDATVLKAIKTGKPLSDEVITKITTRYSDSLLKLRGDMIARTETLRSLNASSYQSIKQAIALGSTKANNVKRIWDSSGDDGITRPSHVAMEGQEVGLDEPFTTPDGEKLMYPGDSTLGASAKETIACRCRVRLKVDWLADVR